MSVRKSIDCELRDVLKAEVEGGTSVTAIAAELAIITQPGLRLFLRGDSRGSGVLLDALADRYGMRLTKPKRHSKGRSK